MVFAVFEEFCIDEVESALLNCLLECFVLRGVTAAICLVPMSCSHYSSPLTAFICMYQHIAIDISKAACVYTLLYSWRAWHSCLGQNPKLEFQKVHYLKLEPCKINPGLLWVNVCVPVIFKLLSAELRTAPPTRLDFRLPMRWKRDFRFSGMLRSV